MSVNERVSLQLSSLRTVPACVRARPSLLTCTQYARDGIVPMSKTAVYTYKQTGPDCVRASCVRAYSRSCVASLCACVHACTPACVHACVRTCHVQPNHSGLVPERAARS